MIPGDPLEVGKKATLAELAALVGGTVEGDGTLEIVGLASLEDAGEGQVSFLTDLKQASRLEKTRASALIVPPGLPSFPRPLIRTANPYAAYARVQTFFSSGKTLETLVKEAEVIRHKFYIGSMIAGGFMGLVIGMTLLNTVVFRKRQDYEPNRGNCLSCARCMNYCPVEK